ncbi:MAG: DUF5678 domain-containing protein [Desulfobaccales bacterium]|jgi:hypothetical protein
MKVSEDFIGSLRTIIESVPTNATSCKEFLADLDRIRMEWNVTKTGALGLKYWRFFPGFVSEEEAAVIRADRPSTKEGSRMDWLSENLQLIQERYADQWIAVGDHEIIASAPTLPELLTLIVDIDKPLVTFISAEPVEWEHAYGI